MFGLPTLAELIFADHRRIPSLDGGWHDVEKDDCQLPGWDNQPRQECDFTVLERPTTNWSPVK